MNDELARADALQRVLDKDAIREVIARAARGVDRLDAELLGSAFHPDAVEDHHGVVYRGDTIGEELTRVQREGMQATSMHLTTQTIWVDGDRAAAETYYLGVHRPASGTVRLISSGRMLDELERRDGEWRISRRDVIPEMARTLPIDEELPVGDDRGRRDGTDPSYQIRDRVLGGPG